jgi:hypothetical protein
MLRELTSELSLTEAEAMEDLYLAILTEEDSTLLQEAFASLDLPSTSHHITGGDNLLAELDSDGVIFTGANLLDLDELETVVFSPTLAGNLLEDSVDRGSAVLSGNMFGATGSVAVEIEGVDVPFFNVRGSLVEEGVFIFQHLPAGTFRITPDEDEGPWEPSSQLIEVEEGQSLQGINFDRI